MTPNYTMERLYAEYEQSARLLETRVTALETERRRYRSNTEEYRLLYDRLRRLRRTLEETRAWQRMIVTTLKAQGMTDADIHLLTERAA